MTFHMRQGIVFGNPTYWAKQESYDFPYATGNRIQESRLLRGTRPSLCDGAVG